MGKYQNFVAFHSNEYYLMRIDYCRWKLSGGNLFTFTRPNQEQKQKMQLRVPNTKLHFSLLGTS